MSSRAPAVRPDTDDLDRQIAAAQAATTVLWRGEPIPFAAVPARIADLDGRRDRELLAGAYREAMLAQAPLMERRLAAWREAGPSSAEGIDPGALATDLERFVVHSETPYYAALRRYLALIDIEQGDASEADLWHVARGTAWGHWFGDREVVRAAGAAGRAATDAGDVHGWRAAEAVLAGDVDPNGPVVEAAVARAYASVAGAPEWLRGDLGVAAAEVPAVADFIAWARLWRMRRDIGLLHYELRVMGEPLDPALARAYYSGILEHMTGVAVAEEGYLHAIPRPWASVGQIERTLLAAQLVEVLESRHGPAWWREPDATGTIGAFATTGSRDDALAFLGYDALDWRPLLRQVRTRLIGEMSGYGGPNITTRAGTRKV